MIEAKPDALWSWRYEVFERKRHLCTLDMAGKETGHETVLFRHEDTAYRVVCAPDDPCSLFRGSEELVQSSARGARAHEARWCTEDHEFDIERGLWNDRWKMSESGVVVGRIRVRPLRSLRAEFTLAVEWPLRLLALSWAMIGLRRTPPTD